MRVFLLKASICFYLFLTGGYVPILKASYSLNNASKSQDCNCEGGMPHLTFQYQGRDGAIINVFAGDKGRKLIKSFSEYRMDQF